MARYLILGGFEKSGHDATAEAIAHIGLLRGHEVDTYRWRDHLDIGTHLIFNFHRYAASKGAPDVSGMLDEAWISTALAEDLHTHIDVTYAGYISVHPWSSVICAEALVRAGSASTTLVDYTAEYGSFPAVTHPRIDIYAGGGTARTLEPAVRAKCISVGVCVRSQFFSELPRAERDAALCISAGADGWAINSLSRVARGHLLSALQPKAVFLLAPTAAAEISWRDADISLGQIMTGLTDISDVLKQARWYLSKGGGTSIAEGIAAGCQVFAGRSGIFWEDEAIMGLVYKGIAIRAESEYIHKNDAELAAEWRNIRDAGTRLWEAAESRYRSHGNMIEERILDELIDASLNADSTHIPTATKLLRTRLREWRASWKPNP